VPGLMGSRLDVKDDRSGSCNTGGDYDNLWLSKKRILLSISKQCAMEELT